MYGLIYVKVICIWSIIRRLLQPLPLIKIVHTKTVKSVHIIVDIYTLERVCPIVFLDAIHFKVRKENRIVNKAAYSVLGTNLSGHKEILGIWIGENESASFWLGVCNDLKNRGGAGHPHRL